MTEPISDTVDWCCPACGEWNDAFADASGGLRQQMTEDCGVCCRPSALMLSWNEAAGRWRVEAAPES